jgi:hypothetical protein
MTQQNTLRLSDFSTVAPSSRHLRQYFMTRPEGLLQHLQDTDAVTPLPMTVQILREGLNLDDSSLRILDWIYRLRQSEPLRLLLCDYDQSDYHLNIQRMAGMLALSETTLRQALQHQALNKEQRRALLARETLRDQQPLLPTQVTSFLDQLTYLTPGNFATMYRQQQILGQTFTPEQFFTAPVAGTALEIQHKHPGTPPTDNWQHPFLTS